MIIYNAGRRFFAMKADAEAHRKELGLSKDKLYKLTITQRDELAALLDGLCSKEPSGLEAESGEVADNVVIDENEIPDFIPMFLCKDFEKRRKNATV